MSYLKNYNLEEKSRKNNPTQLQRLSADQVKNNAGGYVYEVDMWGRLLRFLVLGTEGGTYYASESKLTKENLKSFKDCLSTDYIRAINLIVEVSEDGRAPKNDPALFALAVAASYQDSRGREEYAQRVREYALSQLNRVARTGTHFLHFIDYANDLRGWGRGFRRAAGEWYDLKSSSDLLYQLMKYGSRDGWTHRDVLRLAHVNPGQSSSKDYVDFSQLNTVDREAWTKNVLYDWATKGGEGLGAFESWEEVTGDWFAHEYKRADFSKTTNVKVNPDNEVLERLWAVERVKHVKTDKEVAELILKYDLPREVIPTERLNSVLVWEALLVRMPMTALIRNLGKLTSIGVLGPMSKNNAAVIKPLLDANRLQKARVHPLQILIALKVYEQGHGEKGNLSWTPVRQIVDALNQAFYISFKTFEPANKRTLIGVDLSGSMTVGQIAGLPGITPNMAAAAMALVIANSEPEYYIHGFAGTFRDLNISPQMLLPEAMRLTQDNSWGSTDCALPMTEALKHKWEVDTFIVITDNDTWSGGTHVDKALNNYRQKMGIPARLAVFGMTSSSFSIANPKDRGQMDFVGFDSAAPQVLTDFSRGNI